jgi:hypothetical protein
LLPPQITTPALARGRDCRRSSATSRSTGAVPCRANPCSSAATARVGPCRDTGKRSFESGRWDSSGTHVAPFQNKNPRFTGVLEADEGTRTLDLLHGKPCRARQRSTTNHHDASTMRVYGVRGRRNPHGCAARFRIVWGMNGARDQGPCPKPPLVGRRFVVALANLVNRWRCAFSYGCRATGERDDHLSGRSLGSLCEGALGELPPHRKGIWCSQRVCSSRSLSCHRTIKA